MKSMVEERWQEFHAEDADYTLIVLEALDYHVDQGDWLFGPDYGDKRLRAELTAQGINIPDGCEGNQGPLTHNLPLEFLRNLVLHKQLLALHAYAFYGLPVAGPAVMTGGGEGIPDGADTRMIRSRLLGELVNRVRFDLWDQPVANPAETAGWLALANLYYDGWQG